ncbi:hypothetical protein BJF78_25490 [Pseudonocardia sp. CNS-139]|nr:hypothetical protein BJF78_25490 [Pseudonocardia sp. CNS-139]
MIRLTRLATAIRLLDRPMDGSGATIWNRSVGLSSGAGPGSGGGRFSWRGTRGGPSGWRG